MKVVPQRAELPSPARQRCVGVYKHWAATLEEFRAPPQPSSLSTPDYRKRPPSPSLWPARATGSEAAAACYQETHKQAVGAEERGRQRQTTQKTAVITSALQTAGSAYIRSQKARDTRLREKKIDFTSRHYFPYKRTARDEAILLRAQSAPLFTSKKPEETRYKCRYPGYYLFYQFRDQQLQAQTAANVFDNSSRLFLFRSSSATTRSEHPFPQSIESVEKRNRRPLIVGNGTFTGELARSEQIPCYISEMDRFLATQYDANGEFGPMLGEVGLSCKITSEPPEYRKEASNSSSYDSAKNSLEHYLAHRRKCFCK